MDVSINEYRRLVGTGGWRDIRRQYIFDIRRRIAGIVIPVWIRLSCCYLCHHTSTKGENERVIGPKINIESLTVGHEMINFVRVGLLRKPSLVDTHSPVRSSNFVISILKNLLACLLNHRGQHKFGWFIVNYDMTVVSFGWPNIFVLRCSLLRRRSGGKWRKIEKNEKR